MMSNSRRKAVESGLQISTYESDSRNLGFSDVAQQSLCWNMQNASSASSNAIAMDTRELSRNMKIILQQSKTLQALIGTFCESFF